MSLTEFYKQRINDLQHDLKKLSQRKSAFGWLRFGSIAAIIVAFYILWSIGIWYVIIISIVLFTTFIKLLLADLKNKERITYTTHLININEDELKFLSGEYISFNTGEQHIPKEHSYANDLDIFGHASLFQYINRTTSEMGSSQLAEYFLSPADLELITERQTAIKELSKKIHFRQDLQAIGRDKKILLSTKMRLLNWVEEQPVFSKFKHWKWLRYLLPAIILSVVALYIFNFLNESVLYVSLFVFAVIAYQVNKYVAPIHEKLSKISDELKTFSNSIELIEKETFESTLLIELQSVFKHSSRFSSGDIKQLHKILDKLDLRYNLVLSAPLNILLLWNLQQVLDLEKWKSKHQNKIDLWFNTLAKFEALNSFAALHFNQPGWIFPTVTQKYFLIKGMEVGHPLIADDKRINNNIKLKNEGELMLVTGSNMAGKSTYLRSIGVNVVLAMAGSPVCAKEFTVSHVQLVSSMRITDNLAESTSTFYAELKKLKAIIEMVNKNQRVFILLDEILRGTNSLDRHTGSVALIKQLIKHNAAAIIATHDLELAKLAYEFPEKIINYHFDVQVSNDELFFDYILKKGVCTSLNASILMKKIGIEL